MSFENQDNYNRQNTPAQGQGYTNQNSYTPSPYRPANTPASASGQQDYYGGYASYRQAGPEIEPDRPKKQGGALKTLAMFMAVAVIAGASGGGVTYVMMKNDTGSSVIWQEPPAASSSEVSKTADSAPPVDSAAIPPAVDSVDLADIIENAAASVVEIEVEITSTNPFFGEYSSPGGGSGVIFSTDGYIITNDHVTTNATKLLVRTSDGSEYEATLVGADSKTDLAVIKIEAEGLTPVTFGDSDSIRVGETAIAIGNPLGTLGGTVTTGIISGKDREATFETGETMTNLIQTSAAVNPGNSGGGLFDSNGRLIGIVNAKPSGGTEGLGFAIPANLVKSVSADLINNGYVTGRPEIGITPIEILNTQDAFRYRVNDLGVYVGAVNRDNGLVVSDFIVSIDGEPVESTADITNALSKKKPGDTMVFVVRRDGSEVTVNVLLTEKIPDHIKQKMESAQPF